MGKEYYYVYCKNILGIKTNNKNFKWIYGNSAPVNSYENFERCLVKFECYVKPEKYLDNIEECEKSFQSYSWNSKKKIITFRRKFFSLFNIGFNMQFNGNTVKVDIGKNYFKFIKNRTMNLHSFYYLLSDIANILLLKNGYITLYSSAICNVDTNNSTIHFAPPCTGKTFIAEQFCKHLNYKLIGEDIVISDGIKLYSCPWTNSYRNKSNKFDSAGSIKRIKRSGNMEIMEECTLNNILVLSLGPRCVVYDKEYVYKKICILNGYLFAYFSSPIVKILSYFDEYFCLDWSLISSKILKKIVEECDCALLQCDKPDDFFEFIKENKKV